VNRTVIFFFIVSELDRRLLVWTWIALHWTVDFWFGPRIHTNPHQTGPLTPLLCCFGIGFAGVRLLYSEPVCVEF